jgi:hypothetical protein
MRRRISGGKREDNQAIFLLSGRRDEPATER